MNNKTTAPVRSFKVGIKTRSCVDWASNGLRFKTREETETYGRDLAYRWTAVVQWTVLDSEDEPNR